MRPVVEIALLSLATLAAGARVAGAQSSPGAPGAPNGAPGGAPAQAAASSACAAPQFHQFDFWIGEWDVTDSSDESSGTNSITSILGGCVIHEKWHAEQGIKNGESYSMYDSQLKQWHQTWVDDSGNLWKIDGAFRDGRMVMTRVTPSLQNPKMKVIHRWTWTKIDDDHVRQLYDASPDGGKTWKVLFDGRYARRK